MVEKIKRIIFSVTKNCDIQMSVSINKVLLGNSNIYYLHIVYGCLCLPQSTPTKKNGVFGIETRWLTKLKV